MVSAIVIILITFVQCLWLYGDVLVFWSCHYYHVSTDRTSLCSPPESAWRTKLSKLTIVPLGTEQNLYDVQSKRSLWCSFFWESSLVGVSRWRQILNRFPFRDVTILLLVTNDVDKERIFLPEFWEGACPFIQKISKVGEINGLIITFGFYNNICGTWVVQHHAILSLMGPLEETGLKRFLGFCHSNFFTRGMYITFGIPCLRP